MDESIPMLTVGESSKEEDKDDVSTSDLAIVDVSETDDVATAADDTPNAGEDVAKAGDVADNVAKAGGDVEEKGDKITVDVTSRVTSHVTKADGIAKADDTTPLLTVKETSKKKENKDDKITVDVTNPVTSRMTKANDVTELITKVKPAVKTKTMSNPIHPKPGQTINRQPPGNRNLYRHEQQPPPPQPVRLSIMMELVYRCCFVLDFVEAKCCGTVVYTEEEGWDAPIRPPYWLVKTRAFGNYCKTGIKKGVQEMIVEPTIKYVIQPIHRGVIQPIHRGVIQPVNRRVVQPLVAIDARISIGNVVSIVLAAVSILFTLKSLKYYENEHESCSKCSFIGVNKEIACLVIASTLLVLRWYPRHRLCPNLTNTFLARYREVLSMGLAALGALGNFLSLMRWYIQEGSVAVWYTEHELGYVLEDDVRDIMMLLLIAFIFNFMEFSLMLLTQMGPKYKDLNPHLTASMAKHKVSTIQVTP